MIPDRELSKSKGVGLFQGQRLFFDPESAHDMTDPFWETKSLDEMNREEWESLCDGCAKCCLHKLEDIDTGDICYTNIACRLIDKDKCQCTQYKMRSKLVPDCISLTPENLHELHWLPSTCAYRLLRDGEDLPDWHPLITGDPQSTVKSGNSIRGRFISEDEVEENLEDYVVSWPL